MTRTEILEHHPLIPYLERAGTPLRGSGAKRLSSRCALTEHRPQHWCVTIDAERGVWFCNDCQKGGSVIDWEMIAQGVNAGEALRRLGGGETAEWEAPRESRRAPQDDRDDELTRRLTKVFGKGHLETIIPSGEKRLVATYDYTDENGTLLYQVCRYAPKDFRQRQPDGAGGWRPTMEGVRRVPYRLPEIMAADVVWIAEGEKDADTLAAMGFTATTNVGGAKKWDASYSPFLRGKDVVLLPDGDPAGAEHLEVLRRALGPVARSIRVVPMPEGIKDVSDFAETFAEPADAASALVELAEKAEMLYRGQSVPVQTMAEMELAYRRHLERAATHRLALSAWLPGFADVRPLVPGELVTFLAGTGCGKTMLLQNLALHTRLPTLMFEVELPDSLNFERFAAMATKTTGRHVESVYQLNGSVDWRQPGGLDHVGCVHLSRLNVPEIKRIIELTELKTGRRPVLVLVDYVQLVQGAGESRYDRVSGIAEELKVVAKETETIIVMASQIGRAATARHDDGGQLQTREVSLTDAKESGSIENSSGLVIGAWRDGDDTENLWLRILKNTKGRSGRTILCRIADSLLIHEQVRAEDAAA